MLYDTHCHPYLAKEKSQENILENFFSGGGKLLNSVACDLESSLTCISLAKKDSKIKASIGIHPTHVMQCKFSLSEAMQQLEGLYLGNSEYIVAIGETGLDYHWLESLSQKHTVSQEEIIQIQKDFFRAQIQLAKKLELPLIIHNRLAKNDVFKILRQENFTNFVFHCYSEDLEYARELLKFAPHCKLGFGGVMTFKNTKQVQETAKHVPLKNIILETDSPYLTPTPLRGKQENEPLYTQYVLDSLSRIRDESPDEIEIVVFENSCKFFGI